MHLEPKILCRSPKTKIAMPIWPRLRFYFQSWFFQGYPSCANLSLDLARAQSFSSHPGSAETTRLHWGFWQGQEISAALKPCLNKASGSVPPELSGRPPWAARTPLNLSTIGAEPFDNRDASQDIQNFTWACISPITPEAIGRRLAYPKIGRRLACPRFL